MYTYILNDTSNATGRVFDNNFKTTQDIEMKTAGTIEKFVRRVLKAKFCQPTFMKKRPGQLDTPHLIFKSHKKCVANKDSYNSSSAFFFSFCHKFLFLPQYSHKGKKNSQKYKSYARTHRGMRLLHDGATSHTARKTVNLLQANRVNILAIQITDLNRINHIWDVISCVVRRRYPANVIQFEQFVRYRWKGIEQRTCMLYVALMRSCWLAVIGVNGGLIR